MFPIFTYLIYTTAMKSVICLFMVGLFLSVFMCCQPRVTRLNELNRAESMMEECPDSVLKILEEIKDPEKLNEEESATYCLLLTQARDKNYVHHTSDSIINIAVKYFINQKNPYRKAQVFFYSGRVNHELNQPEKAAENYLKAVPYAQETKEYKMLTLIYNSLGNLYREQEWDEKALEANLKAVEYCSLAKDTMNLPYVIRNMGRTYMCIPCTDSAEIYYKRAFKHAVRYKNELAQLSILNDLAIAYRQMREYQKGIEVMRHLFSLNGKKINNASYSLTLGSLYLLVNELDSAEVCFHVAKNGNDIFTRMGACQYLYEKALKEKDYKSAVNYNEEYTLKHDSLSAMQQQDEIQKLTYKYEKNELKRTLELEAAHAKNTYMGIIILLLIVLSLGCAIYLRYRWSKERMLRLQERMLEREKVLRVRTESEYQKVLAKLESYHYQEYEKNKSDLVTIQADLIHTRDCLVEKESELIALKKKETELQNCLFEKTGFTERIKAAGVDATKREIEVKPFVSKDMPLLIETLNEVYSGFIIRLKDDYPNLNDTEIAICSLLKAGAKTKNIAWIISMTPNAVSRKKNQIMKKIGIIDEVASLERFLEAF